MDFKKIKKLVSLVETSDISSLSVEEDNLKVEIKRKLNAPVPVIQHTVPAQAPTAPVEPPIAPTSIDAPAAAEEPSTDANLTEIKSPMVGTFYASPNPESPAFVTPGKTISQGDIICIVEAMKLFNEIEADISGTVEKICVQNGDPVEFGQTLFLVRKS
ncbi:MAG: acetyl-CoA carboxylase biotin carboxyl carrier protein [Candidatus Margulisiibacteriota bacterium]|nr:acetyl-CoA carboxylase biotin carboxyl carrier protein [Candidatus Margulisiibacteriota bacterium]